MPRAEARATAGEAAENLAHREKRFKHAAKSAPSTGGLN